MSNDILSRFLELSAHYFGVRRRQVALKLA